jgi:tRNA-specific 2-thiouridylase
VHQFTIGQRKGLGFSTGKALYVLGLDVEKNRVIVGEDDDLRATDCELEGVNWIAPERPSAPLRVMAKIRHKHEPAPATVEAFGEAGARLLFDVPQRAITPGQAAVFYKSGDGGDCVVGGGWIR